MALKSLRSSQRIPRTPYPHSAEREYYAAILREFTVWWNELQSVLKQAGLLRLDDEFSDQVFDAAKARWGERVEQFRPTIERTAKQVEYLSLRGFSRQIDAWENQKERRERKLLAGRTMGINLFAADPAVANEVRDFTRANVRLVKSIGDQAADRLETLVTDTNKNGTPTRELRKLLQEEFDYSKNRAKLISVDQIGKLNGNINRVRHQSVGINGYYWRGMLDARERKHHVAREGQYFDYRIPPFDGNPGQPIRCRCTAEPALDDVQDFGLTPSEIAQERTTQSSIRQRQLSQIAARQGVSATLRAQQIQENRSRGAIKAARTRRIKQAAVAAAAVTGLAIVGRKLALHDFEREFLLPVYATPRVSMERSYWFDEFGRVIGSKTGLENSIQYTAEEIAAMRNARFTHSHPAGMPLSWNDIAFAVTNNLKEIRAVGISGSTARVFTLERVGDVWTYRDGNQIDRRFGLTVESIHNNKMKNLQFLADLEGISIKDLSAEKWYDELIDVTEQIVQLINCDFQVVKIDRL